MNIRRIGMAGLLTIGMAVPMSGQAHQAEAPAGASLPAATEFSPGAGSKPTIYTARTLTATEVADAYIDDPMNPLMPPVNPPAPYAESDAYSGGAPPPGVSSSLPAAAFAAGPTNSNDLTLPWILGGSALALLGLIARQRNSERTDEVPESDNFSTHSASSHDSRRAANAALGLTEMASGNVALGYVIATLR